MNQSLMEALAYVLSELHQSSLSADEVNEVSEILSNQGFSIAEIHSAIEFLRPRISNDSKSAFQVSSTISWRVIQKNELYLFTAEALETLYLCQRLRIISVGDIEVLMDFIKREEDVPIDKDGLFELMTDVLLENGSEGNCSEF